jgi:hypothetical protein
MFDCRNDRHKSDCICAVCQVTRRKKERDEIVAVIDNETAAMDSNPSEQHDMEVSLNIYIILFLLLCFLVKGSSQMRFSFISPCFCCHFGVLEDSYDTSFN